MVFAHDTAVALGFVVDLVHTLPGLGDSRVEDLTTRADLEALMAPWEWTGRPARTTAELEAVKDLRPRLRATWLAAHDDVPAAAADVNDLLREFGALPQLVIHGSYGWHIHATDPDAPVAARMAVEAAMALVDVIRMEETSRLRTCAGDECEDLVLDLSKNRSKLYCTGGCANKAHVTAYRQRQRRKPTAGRRSPARD